MSEVELPEDVPQDTRHFVNTFCDFHEAFPDENQHVFGQIFEQMRKAEKPDTDYIPSEKGQEEIWTFEKSNVKVYKRVFHPGRGERPVGVDFALYKEMKSKVGATAVQVKRNRNKDFFEFSQRDLNQLSKLTQFWGSAYYLMVDETIQPPLYCFLTANEVDSLIYQAGGTPPVRILNKDVRKHCRGLDNFYDLFYSCNRGSLNMPKDYNANLVKYIQETKRIVVELSAKRSNTQGTSKITEKPRHDYDRRDGKINSFLETL